MLRELANERLDLHKYLYTAWRWKWLLLAIVIAIPVAVYFVSSGLTKTYQAKTVLFVQQTTVASPEFSEQTSVSTSSPATVARLVETPVVADIAAKKLDEPNQGRQLLPSVNASLDENIGSGAESNFLTITATSSDPKRAADVAEAFGKAVAKKRSKDVENAIDRTLEQLGNEEPALSALGPTAKLNLASEIQKLRTLRSTQEGATQIVDPVQVPTSAVSPQPVRNTVLGFIFAVLLAIGLLPILDRLDRKVRTPGELEDIMGASMLAMIPPGAFPGNAPTPQVREAFQTLRAGLTYFNVDRSLDSVIITSPSHAEGKTTVAVNLAVALALDGRDVILVDADLRRPQILKRLGLDSAIGLDAVLLGDRSTNDALVEVPRIAGGRLRVLPTVSPASNPSVLLSSERMQRLLDELEGLCDVVLIDTPPLLVVSDAIPLVKEGDGVVAVARMDVTNRDALKKTREVIDTAGGTVLGVVATGTRQSGLYGYELYGYDSPSTGDTASFPALTPNGGSRRGLFGRRRRNGATANGNGSRADAADESDRVES